MKATCGTTGPSPRGGAGCGCTVESFDWGEAQCLAEFLAHVLAAPDGVPAELAIPSDGRGFMLAAFRHYVAARKLTNQLHEPVHAGDTRLLDQRLGEVKLANMTLVTHE